MQYNSQKEQLVMPEYGRNVQLMVDYAKTIEDKAFRQAFVEQVIKLMHQINSQGRSLEEQLPRLWKHIFRIAHYELDVESPTGDRPTQESDQKKPNRVPYPSFEARYRHYGHHVQTLLKKAIELPEGPIKTGLVHSIASYMKLAYQTWNREHYVSDELIKSDLLALSGGKLFIGEHTALENLASPKKPQNKKRSFGNGGHGGKQFSRSKGKRRK